MYRHSLTLIDEGTSEMHASLERRSPVTVDSTINSLSWRGDASGGWLAVGNSNRVVGVTYTDGGEAQREGGCHEELSKQNMRRNFNFREHSQNVSLSGTYQPVSLCVCVSACVRAVCVYVRACQYTVAALSHR